MIKVGLQPLGQYVSGHRGACSMAPENTMAAFREAYYHGADMISIDVHRTADNKLVVIHDATVDRTTNGHGAVKDLTLAQLRALDAGSRFSPLYKGEKIHTLDEVLDWAHGKMSVDIELKQPSTYPGIEQQVADSLRVHHMEGQAMVDSFDHNSATRFKQLAPEITTGFLLSPKTWLRSIRTSVNLGSAAGLGAGMVTGAAIGRTFGAIPGLGAIGMAVGIAGGYLVGSMLGRHRTFKECTQAPIDVVLPQWAMLSRHWVSKLHHLHMGVMPYTENNRVEVHHLQHHFKVDTIITDCPQRFDPRRRDPVLELGERCTEALERLGCTSVHQEGRTLEATAASAETAAALGGLLQPQVGPWTLHVSSPGPSSPEGVETLPGVGQQKAPSDAKLLESLQALPRVIAVSAGSGDKPFKVQAPDREDVGFLSQLLQPTVGNAHLVVEQGHAQR